VTGAPGSTQDAAPGRIVANYGRRLLVEDESGERHLCVPKGRRLNAVCGDRVDFRPAHSASQGVVVAVHERTAALTRPDSRGRTEVIAANISQLCCVVAPRPAPDWALADRYLAAAAIMGIRSCVVLNKTDLLKADADFAPLLEEFRAAGFAVFETSVREPGTLDDLRNALRDATSILVGQSGVGKSSLLNALVPGLDAATASVSRQTGAGRHTTTVSILHALPSGGEIIDSPGVRDYAPVVADPVDVIRGFPELLEFDGTCRFNDCRHVVEPDCAARAAVRAGTVSERRYRSYVWLREQAEELARRDRY